MSAAVGGPNRSAANQKAAPSATPLPPKGKLPNSVPVTHQNGAMPSGSAAVNGFKPPIPPKPTAAPATIAKQMSQQSRDDGKSTPAAASAAKIAEVAGGKVAVVNPQVAALQQKIEANVPRNAQLARDIFSLTYAEELIRMQKLGHKNIAVNSVTMLAEAAPSLALVSKFNPIEKAAFEKVLNATVSIIAAEQALSFYVGLGEPNIAIRDSKIVQAAVIAANRNHPLHK